MSATKDKSFWDTNLWVYLNTDSQAPNDIAKKTKLQTLLLLNGEIAISAQVLNELANVLMKKYGQTEAEVLNRLEALADQVELIALNEQITFQALKLKAKYKTSWFDSLIITTALQSGCTILYSEDLQNNLLVEGQLSVINPFTN
ncbi:MAG: PIN domain-containing protein [Saprospiraceae bacterium]|jgi:predicted nucleic acid-binding protein|nr:PIN domain-containing protein [Saprospiraceae bacterium]